MKEKNKIIFIFLILYFLNYVNSAIIQDQTLPDFFQLEDNLWDDETTGSIPKERNKYIIAAYRLGDPAVIQDYVDKRQGIIYKANPKIRLCWNGEDITTPTNNLYNQISLYKSGIVSTNNGGNPIDFGTFGTDITSTTNNKMLYEYACQADKTKSQSLFFPFWINNNMINDYMTTWFKFKLVNTENTTSRITFQIEHFARYGKLTSINDRKNISPEITIPAYSIYEVEISVERLIVTNINTAQIFPDFKFTTFIKPPVNNSD